MEGTLRRPTWIHKTLSVVRPLAKEAASRLGRPAPFADGWESEQVAQLASAANAIAANPAGLRRTAGVAVLGHAVDLLSLYCVFLAFQQSVSCVTLVTGFAIGVLFWVVGPTLQGIGVVEGVMALVFSRLGVPMERAVAIALTFRALTFWLPLLVGLLLFHCLGDPGGHWPPPGEPSAR